MFCGPVVAELAENISESEPDLFLPVKNISHEEIVYERIRYWCYNVFLPIVFLFGIIGNILNVVIFR